MLGRCAAAIAIVLLGVTHAHAGTQLFEASWTVKAHGNECALSKVGTSGGVTLYPWCAPARSGESRTYSAFGIPQGIQCNPHWPRCHFSETPTDGYGNFAPLGGSQMKALYCGAISGPRPAKGFTLTTGGKNKRPIPPLYRNPAFFTAGGAPNQTSCTATSTDGFGGKGKVQAGRPITGSAIATTTRTAMGAVGGFQFPAAASGSGPGLRATGVVGEFNVLYPYGYSYTYVTIRNATGFFGPGSGLGNAYIKLPRQDGAVNAHIEIAQGAAKFGGVMKMLGALTTKVCYYRAGGCSLGLGNWKYDVVGTTGDYRSAGGQITKGYQTVISPVYFNTGLGVPTTVRMIGSRFGWTTGSVTVTAVGRGSHKTVHYAHGYDNRATTSQGAQTGTIQLVTPLLTQWLQPAAKFETGGIGILRLRFVPEPRGWLVLVAGIGVLAVGNRLRRSRSLDSSPPR